MRDERAAEPRRLGALRSARRVSGVKDVAAQLRFYAFTISRFRWGPGSSGRLAMLAANPAHASARESGEAWGRCRPPTAGYRLVAVMAEKE